jgi:hypothetical protein
VLDGSVRRSGDRIRVSAELNSASDGRELWSQTYERALADVFAVQDEITREIVAARQVRLVTTGAVGAMSARGGTADLQAYDLYLRALQLYRQGGNALPKPTGSGCFPGPDTIRPVTGGTGCMTWPRTAGS